MPCFAGRTMALDEANALVKRLLEQETQPDRRAKLVALQLALGWPYALEVEPEHLAELRAREPVPVDLWRAQVWLGAASGLAFVWCAAGIAFWAWLTFGDPTLSVVLTAFAIGPIHAAVGAVSALQARSDRGVPALLAWLWPLGPAFSLAVSFAFDRQAFWSGLICATPSMLVSLAASRVARHTAAR